MKSLRVSVVMTVFVLSLGILTLFMTAVSNSLAAPAEQSGVIPERGEGEAAQSGESFGPEDTGGPDGFGYTFIDSNEPGGPIYSFIEISSTGTAFPLPDNSLEGPLSLGFDFNFYGTNYSEVSAASNGYLWFNNGVAHVVDSTPDCPLPNTLANENYIAVLHDDLDGQQNAPNGMGYYEAFAPGSCPYGGYGGACFIVEWDGTYHDATTDDLTFQVILFDDSNFLIQFEDVGNEAGSASTTGIENGDATIGLTYACDTAASISDTLAILYEAPSIPILSSSIKSGPAVITTGLSITYELLLINTGTASSTNTFLTDTIPAGTTYITNSVSCAGGTGTCSYSPSLNAVTWAGSIDVGETVTVEFAVDTSTNSCGTIIDNVATLTDPNAFGSPYTLQHSTGLWDIFTAYDFEANDGGFVPGFSGFPGPSDWEWGVPTAPPDLGATSGTNVWATVLDGLHNNTNGSSLLTKTVDLTGFADSAELSWSHFLQANNSGFDLATVRVNGDTVFDSSGDPDTPDWTMQSVPVGNYVGGSAEIVFDFFATTVTNDFGWYIDDVTIASCAPPDTPIFDDSSKSAPTTAASGSAYTYTVSINNTGATATSTMMTDPIPSGTTYVPGSATNGATYNSGLNQIEWTGNVSATTSVDVSFMVTATLTSGTVMNTAVISHSQIMTPVMVTATTTVVAAPAIVVEPDSLSSTQAPDTQVTQTLTISNVGTAALNWDIVEQDSTANFDSTLGADAQQVADPADAGVEVDTAASPGANTSPAAAGNDGPTFAPEGFVLYDNGPLVNGLGTGVGGADESILQTTSLGMNTLGFGHALSALDRAADDFTIPGGSTWELDQITFFAYQTGSTTTSPITGVNLQIWDGEPGNGGTIIWGDTTTNILVNTVWAGIYRVSETTTGSAVDRPIMANTVDLGGLVLPAGTYWLDWQTDGTLASGPWAPPITINGVAVTGNGLSSGDNGTTWAPALDSGTGTPQQGFPFIIEGTPGCASGDIPWVLVSPSSGTTAAGAATDVDVVFDSTGLANGDYTGTLCVTSDDPVTPVVEVSLTLTVEGGNLPPVAVGDSYSTTQDTALNVPAPGVLDNDSDPDGDGLTAVLDTDVSDGTLTLNADGSFTYTPDPGFSGTDSFTYHANDGTADSNTVTVTIDVIITEYKLYLPIVLKADSTQAQMEGGLPVAAGEDWASIALAAFPMMAGMWFVYRRNGRLDG